MLWDLQVHTHCPFYCTPALATCLSPLAHLPAHHTCLLPFLPCMPFCPFTHMVPFLPCMPCLACLLWLFATLWRSTGPLPPSLHLPLGLPASRQFGFLIPGLFPAPALPLLPHHHTFPCRAGDLTPTGLGAGECIACPLPLHTSAGNIYTHI